jgi:hypothetical protein
MSPNASVWTAKPRTICQVSFDPSQHRIVNRGTEQQTEEVLAYNRLDAASIADDHRCKDGDEGRGEGRDGREAGGSLDVYTSGDDDWCISF